MDINESERSDRIRRKIIKRNMKRVLNIKLKLNKAENKEEKAKKRLSHIHSITKIKLEKKSLKRQTNSKKLDNEHNSPLKNKHKKLKKFEIKKANLDFDPLINYYLEYWKMFNENEYILAKIKENLYEINNMKGHLEELKSINLSNTSK